MTTTVTRLGARLLAPLALSTLWLTSCTDLELTPLDTATPNVLFTDEESYTAFIARVYAGLAVTGQNGPQSQLGGAPDISGIDEGFSSYVRALWKLQELPTDEAIITWGDPGLDDLVETDWDANNAFVNAMYARAYFQVALANEFIRESTPELLAERGIPEGFQGTVASYRAEARFLRALSYYHILDLFGTGPFFTEEQAVGGTPPPQGSAEEIFGFVESELAAVADLLPAPGQAQYGRVDQGAVYALQSRLFLNAPVYVGQDRNADAAAAALRVIDAGAYALEDTYADLFRADNNTSDELIFAIPFDGENTQTFGGTTFLVHGALGGDAVDPLAFGVNVGWGGMRTNPEFVDFFDDPSGDTDGRALFFTEGQTREIESRTIFEQGFLITKWSNITSEGLPGSDLTFVDTDFPLFRLGEVYLNYAEAVVRGGSDDRDRAVALVNELRARALDSERGDVGDGDLTLEFLFGERSRETYWECLRRTDLRRYGLYTGDAYVWTFKGNEVEGASMPAFRDVFPIPAPEIQSNPNLTQNDGY